MKRRTRIFLVLLAAGALFHVPALFGGFVWDDHLMVEQNPEIRDFGTIPEVFSHNYFGDRANSELFRPLVNVSLAVDYHLYGHDSSGRPTPFGYHLTNLLLHLGVTLLLWRLLQRITVRPWLPEVAALLFFVDPASSEPVAWIVARADLMAFALVLVVIFLHLAGRRHPWVHLLALVAYLAALFSKLVAAPAPLFVFLIEWIFFGLRAKDLLRGKNLLRYAAYLIPIGIYFAVRIPAMGSAFPRAAGVTLKTADLGVRLFAGGAVLARSVYTILVPVGMCADYSADRAFDDARLQGFALMPAVVCLAIGLAVLVALAILIRRRRPWFAFGVLFAIAALLPVSEVIRIGAVMADRYLYVPAAGILAALAAGLLLLPRWRVGLFLLVFLTFGSLTAAREHVFLSDGTMNRDVLASYPANGRAWNRLGLFYGRRGDRTREVAAYREGLRHDPGNRYLRKNYGAVLFETGRLKQAKAELWAALESDSHYDRETAAIAYDLARVLYALGDKGRAREVLTLAVRKCPPFPLASRLLDRINRELLR